MNVKEAALDADRAIKQVSVELEADAARIVRLLPLGSVVGSVLEDGALLLVVSDPAGPSLRIVPKGGAAPVTAEPLRIRMLVAHGWDAFRSTISQVLRP